MPMPESVKPSYNLSLNCDLCARSHPLSEIALRGKRNFCRTCATEHPEKCLASLQSDRKSRWPAVRMAAISLGIFIGVGVVTVKFLPWNVRLHLRRWVATAGNFTAQPAAALPETKLTANATPAPAGPKAPIPSAPGTAEAKGTEPSWSKFLFSDLSLHPDPKRRVVEDAGHLHLLFVTRPGTDACMGMASQVYATREAPDTASAKLMSEVGKDMTVSFDEGLRYVRKRSRDWEQDFSVRLSFEDKFTSKDGGSAGTGFTIMMLAATEGIPIDPQVAVTGDLTVDGAVQPVGAVVDKLRGAILGGCKITLVPERNARDVTDLALLDGPAPLWETQIFSIGTIDQALGLARADRTGAVREAIERFTALRARLPATVTPNYLQSPIVQTELREVLRLAPNHLSAATLLQAAENQLPKELSLNRSVEEIIAASYLFVSDVAGSGEGKARPQNSGGQVISTFPDREFNQCLKNLQRLSLILDHRSQDLKMCCIAYASAQRSAATYRPPDFATIRSSSQWNYIAKRESGIILQVNSDVQDTRSRLLLALRKLDTDGSLMAELLKK